ncbi:MAG: exodeoxyribonuclease III [Planctomycetota bacterium]|nr:exodeoxyribonuclease III [Planctomycetota bacterium]
MRLITWNVNSIRTRLERVLALLERHDPDVLCLQETKVVDEDFPRSAFEDRGWHVETHGQRTYNGVALISKKPAEDVTRGMPDDAPDEQRRVIAATYDGVRVIDVYVPNGKDVATEHFTFKLGWLERLLASIEAAHSPDDPVVLLGDFNIAPDERDVHDPARWRGKVHFHPEEHARLARFHAWGFHDLLRWHTREEGLYSWWDYRNMGFQTNQGLRIDLILATEPMADRSEACWIDRAEREGKQPSDHAPVVGDFEDA